MLQRVAFGLGALMLAAACGGDYGSRTPTAPSQPPASSTPPPPTAQPQGIPQIGGAWNGTHEMQFDGARTFRSITMTLAQTEREITGSWRLTSPGSDMRGDVTGTILGDGNAARFTGSVTVITDTPSGTGRCHGVAAMNSDGPVSAQSMRWVGPNVQFTTCQTSIGGLVWSVSR